MRAIIIILAVISYKTECDSFCKRLGYSCCVESMRAPEGFFCANFERKDGVFEMDWNVRWAPGYQVKKEREAEQD